MNIKKQYIVNEKGEKKSVVLDVKTFEWMLDLVDTYFCERAAKKARPAALKQIERGEYITLDEIKRELEKKGVKVSKRRKSSAA